MNYFFGFNNGLFKSELQIPLFKNKIPKKENINLYEATISKNEWEFQESKNYVDKSDFFILKNEMINNNKIYFLAKKKDFQNLENSELKNFNDFTDTSPAFRCNFKLYIEGGGFSSYQSEYPYSMTKINGSILSSIGTLLDKKAEKNYLIFRNIYFKPINQEFEVFFININEKKILKKIIFKTNFTNFIEIEKDLISPEVYLFTKDFLGIPIYISTKNKHLSFEHTHPPHAYFFGTDAFKNVKKLKEKINEIIL